MGYAVCGDQEESGAGGGIWTICRTELCANLRMSCLPGSSIDGLIPAYDDFLDQRRKLMALKIRPWFETL